MRRAVILRREADLLKNKIELIRDEKRQVLLTWHMPDGDGGIIPIATEFSDDVDDETRQKIIDICNRPMNLREGDATRKVFYGSSAHFMELPKVLGRLGFRVRLF